MENQKAQKFAIRSKHRKRRATTFTRTKKCCWWARRHSSGSRSTSPAQTDSVGGQGDSTAARTPPWRPVSASQHSVEGVDGRKVVDVTVERRVTSTAGSSTLCGRERAAERDVAGRSDGARCMRVALQRKTPSARRLHCRKVDDAIELREWSSMTT